MKTLWKRKKAVRWNICTRRPPTVGWYTYMHPPPPAVGWYICTRRPLRWAGICICTRRPLRWTGTYEPTCVMFSQASVALNRVSTSCTRSTVNWRSLSSRSSGARPLLMFIWGRAQMRAVASRSGVVGCGDSAELDTQRTHQIVQFPDLVLTELKNS